MATFADIKSVRLKIKDPLGYINLIEVSELPSTVESQTAYTITDSGVYQELKNSTWKTIKLEISDDRISTFIDLYGVEKAVIKCVQDMVMALGKQLSVAQFNSGAESVIYQNLTTTYNFYKNMLATLKEDIQVTSGTNTGRFVPTLNARIGGVSEDTFEW